MTDAQLRPLERVVLRLTESGLSSSDIAWRFRRSPGHIDRVIELSRQPRGAQGSAPVATGTPALRSVERTVIRGLRSGAELPEIASRMRRSPNMVARIEEFANYKMARGATPVTSGLVDS